MGPKWKVLFLIVGALLLWVMPTSLSAAERLGMDAATYSTWRRHHSRFARCVAEIDGRKVIVPFYDRRVPSSAGITVREARKQLSVQVREAMFGGRAGSLKHTRTIKPPDAECRAMAMALPDLAVGQYGYIASVEVEEVLGPDDVVVEDLHVIDAKQLRAEMRADAKSLRDQGYDKEAIEERLAFYFGEREALAERQRDRKYRQEIRLTGFKTDGLKKRMRWSGPEEGGFQIAIVGYEKYGSASRPNYRMVAAPAQRVGLGAGEAEFVQFLSERGYTPKQFVEMLREALKLNKDRDKADAAVFRQLIPSEPEPEQGEDRTANPSERKSR